MKNTDNLNLRLFTPGPAEIPFSVLDEIYKCRTYHRSTDFKELYLSLTSKLKQIFKTQFYITVLTSSGTGAMETAVVNFCSFNDKILYIEQGKFGQRWGLICKAHGFTPEAVTVTPGEVITSIHDIRTEIHDADVIFFTHVETSTGSLTDLKKIIPELKTKTNALVIVDGISSIGSIEFYMDDWGVDVAIAASQKGFMNPPGISVIAYNEKAKDKMERNSTNKFYFDLSRELSSFLSSGYTSWTPAINLFYGMNKACSLILESGTENHWGNIKSNAEYFRNACLKMGFKLFSTSPADSVTALLMPFNISSSELINRIKVNHNIIIADGQDELKGKIIRVSHMGSYTKQDFILLTDVINTELNFMLK